MDCGICGTATPEGARFCGRCGSQLTGVTQSQEAPAEEDEPSIVPARKRPPPALPPGDHRDRAHAGVDRDGLDWSMGARDPVPAGTASFADATLK